MPEWVQFLTVVPLLVTDSLEGDSARGDWTGHMPGVMRPMLKWTTRHLQPVGENAEDDGRKAAHGRARAALGLDVETGHAVAQFRREGE